MRMLVCGACAIIAIGLMAVSATLSYRFSFGLGGTPLEAHAYALAAGGIDILKGCMPFVIFLRLREGRRLAAAAGLMVFAMGVIWSFTSAMGLAAQVRMGKANTADNRIAAYREAKAKLAHLGTEQGKIARKRSLAEITSEIEGKLAAAVKAGNQTRTLGAATDQCQRPTRWTAEACAAVWQLRQELAAASEWDRLDGEVRKVRSRIDKLREDGAGDLATADAQADVLARAIGLLTGRTIDEGWMRLAVVILLGLLLEVGSSCGLYVALGSHALPPSRKEAREGEDEIGEASESGDVGNYCEARLTTEQGGRLTMGKVFEDYAAWCGANGAEPVRRKAFMQGLRAEGHKRGWSIAGGVIHHVTLRC